MSRKTLYELQAENVRKTYLFIVTFSLILFAIGYFLYGISTGDLQE
nr:hypothetical protein [Thermoanaerobacter wiegelii]